MSETTIQRLTKQQMFDRVWDVFVTQGLPKCTTGFECRYRLPNHPGCAIGCNIPEDLVPQIELELGRNIYRVASIINHLLIESITLQRLLPDDEIFLRQLQKLHDILFTDFSDRRRVARTFAQIYGLIAPPE